MNKKMIIAYRCSYFDDYSEEFKFLSVSTNLVKLIKKIKEKYFNIDTIHLKFEIVTDKKDIEIKRELLFDFTSYSDEEVNKIIDDKIKSFFHKTGMLIIKNKELFDKIKIDNKKPIWKKISEIKTKINGFINELV